MVKIFWSLCLILVMTRIGLAEINSTLVESFDTELDTADEEEVPPKAVATLEETIVVSKCCPVASVLVETNLGTRVCQQNSDLNPSWRPTFFDPTTASEVEKPKSYALIEQIPSCGPNEVMFPVYHHAYTDDDLMLLSNGSLAHRLVHDNGDESHRVLYSPEKYCIDDMIITHNLTHSEDNVVDFAYICVNTEIGLHDIIETYVYPIGLAVSIMCLVATFLLYSFLPQLRDLTGKFILGICAFLATTLSLLLVQIFGRRDINVDQLTTEMSLHSSVAGMWLCLTCMGHHVWKIIMSKSVFTRVTDGTRLCYYSIFVMTSLLIIVADAVCVHFLVAMGQGSTNMRIGWECLTAFYVPMMILLLTNVFFYITAQRRISRQIVYNRSMQHFQVNFELFSKLLIVLSVWWLFFMLAMLHIHALNYIAKAFNVISGPMIFCICMCRTRVAFLFKRYFCHDSCCFSCCRSNEFIEEDCKELSIIDNIRLREDKEDNALPTSSLLPGSNHSKDHELSKSLFNVRHHTAGEVPPPSDPDMPVGRVKRLLKSNSLTALANINWGWRRETAV